MGDHWKSLANKLGAPGIDAPASPAPASPAPASPASASPASASPASAESTSAPLNTKAVQPTPAGRVAIDEAVKAQPEPRRLRPAEIRTPEAIAPESISPAPTPAARLAEPPRAVEPASASTDAGRKDKGKRKSSWDTLTSFFGISSSDSSDNELSSSAPAETDTLPAASFTGPVSSASTPAHHKPTTAKPTTAKPTALDELFGDAPRQELSWDKPAPRRLVDDVSGWEVDAEPAPPLADLDDQADTFTPVAEEIDSEVPREGGRRRRRRRRGGRRDRDAEPRSESVSARGPVDISADDADPWVEELLESETVAEDWVEPTSFAADEESDLSDELPDALPERRSNRRRRRGRGRSERDPEGTLPVEGGELEARVAREPREPRSDARESRESREPRDAREPRSRESRDSREGRDSRESRGGREGRAARPVREARGEQGSDEGRREPRAARGRDQTRAHSTRPAHDAPSLPPGEVDLEDEVDSSLAAELETDAGGGNRHPKIPTWADSLEAIIGANMENHRRTDHRGGPPRGRPRSGGGNGGGAGSGRR